jgi:hypothetical protein
VGGGKALDARKTVGPDETLRIRLGPVPESSKIIRVTLFPDDALPADNVVTVSRTEGAGVIKIYGRRDPRLEKALKAIPGVEVRNVWGDPPNIGPAVILGTGCPSLPSGDIAVVNPLGRAGPITVEGRRAARTLVVDAPNDPFLESVPVKDLDVKEVLFGRFPKELRSLISADGLPVVATMPNAGGRILYVGFDISSGGWHTRASFPIFWYNFFGRGQKGYRIDGLLDSSESDLRSKAGVVEGGAENAPPASQTKERDLSPFLLLVMIAATAVLCFSGRR